jgi:hypothetical protein
MTSSLHVSFQDQQLIIARTAGGVPILMQNAACDHRPYLHPIVAPDGLGILTEDAPAHHPWQHGLYTGLNDVNGIGFWTEGLRGAPTDGTFHPHPLEAPTVGENTVRWEVATEWRTPDGSPMLLERQRWHFVDEGATYDLRLDWQLEALVDLTFGRYAYGGLFLRMPFRREIGGEAINSAGQINDQAEMQRADWVAVSMPIPDRPHSADEGWAGIAIFDHSGNREFPSPWRVDNQLGVGPSPCIAGAWQLTAGASMQTRYGFFVFCGRTRPDEVAQRFQRFART